MIRMPGSFAEYDKLKRSVVDLKIALLIARSFDSVVSPAGKVYTLLTDEFIEVGLPVIVRSRVGLV